MIRDRLAVPVSTSLQETRLPLVLRGICARRPSDGILGMAVAPARNPRVALVQLSATRLIGLRLRASRRISLADLKSCRAGPPSRCVGAQRMYKWSDTNCAQMTTIVDAPFATSIRFTSTISGEDFMVSIALGKMKRFLQMCRVEGVPDAIKLALNRILFATPIEPLKSVFDHLNASSSFTIVQIGAYIGETLNDPLARFLKATLTGMERPNAKVVLVEPVKEYFEALKKNYADLHGVRYENAAIAEKEGVRDFYRLAVDPTVFGYPESLAQLGSLRADRMTKLWENYGKDPLRQKFYLEHRIIEKVQCITFKQLLEKHKITEIDFLQIDAEGYDFNILKSIDFSAVRPRFVNYERVLLQNDEKECRKMMRKAGYVLRDWGEDTLCKRRFLADENDPARQ